MNNIEEYRKELNRIDDEIADLLLERLYYVEKIGKEKKKEGIAVLDKNREREIKDRLSEIADNQHEKDYIINIYEAIITESKNVQVECKEGE